MSPSTLLNHEQDSAPPVTVESETYTVISRLSAQEIIAALKNLERNPSIVIEAGGKQKKRKLSVNLNGNFFCIAHRRRINPFARIISGVVKETAEGCTVQYAFHIRNTIRILFSFWFAFVAIILMSTISMLITGGITARRLELIALAVAWLFGAPGLVSFCLIRSRQGEKELESTLVKLINETPHERTVG